MNIDIDLLRTFLEVKRTRHFGKAADNLYVTQSTVSARIKLIESTLGSPVFVRTRNDIQLTSTGQKFVKHAEAIITSWNRAQQEIAITDKRKLTLSVCGMPSLWDIVLQDWLHSTFENFHDIVLSIEVQGLNVMTRRLMEGTLDLAFTFESPLMANMVSREIMNIPLIMVSSKQCNSLDEALAYNYVLVDWGTSFSLSHAAKFGEHIAPALHTGLGRLARDFITDCGGTCYLAESMIIDALKTKKLHPVPGAPVIPRTAYALYPTESEQRKAVENILCYFDAPELLKISNSL